MKIFLSFLLITLLPMTSVFAGNQANVNDTVSKNNIVATAAGSKDHTTLVTALKAADLIDVMANPGPFTVFAPTNAAFAALPKGTVENLLKSENKKDLVNILQYHVFVGALQAKWLKNGQTLNQVNGSDAKIKVDGKKISINGANIIASIKTTNGIIHVIDAVLLPPAKK
ncbi:MAG: fasciclin domain-containing protein [Bacteriovorax sp.]|nr:fasciclin domain-containing protein [Bacteriovorax sp.]